VYWNFETPFGMEWPNM